MPTKTAPDPTFHRVTDTSDLVRSGRHLPGELERCLGIADALDRAYALSQLIEVTDRMANQVRQLRAEAVAEANISGWHAYPRIAERLGIRESHVQHLIQSAGVRRGPGKPNRKG
jgi:hypothetical protein